MKMIPQHHAILGRSCLILTRLELLHIKHLLIHLLHRFLDADKLLAELRLDESRRVAYSKF